MGTRLELHNILLTFCDKVYFQPPAGHRMQYPCIIYHRTGTDRFYANDEIYHKRNTYQITVIDSDPDSLIPDQIEENIIHASIVNGFSKDNLHHTILNLYF